MMDPIRTILFWGHDVLTRQSFLDRVNQDFSDFEILMRTREFKIEDSLMSPCDLVVMELSENFDPLSILLSTWPQVPTLVISPSGSEKILAQALAYPVTDFLVSDDEERYLDLLLPTAMRCLQRRHPRFSFDDTRKLIKQALLEPPSAQRSELDFKQLYSLLRTMTDTVPDMIWAKDLEGRYIYTNTSTCRNLLNAQNTLEPIGQDILEFVLRERELHPEDELWYTYGENCSRTDAETLRRGILTRFKESGYILGSYFILDIYKAPLVDEKGTVIGTVGTARDITLHEETKERYRKLFDHSPDPVVVHIDGILIAANQAAANFIRAESVEEHIGSNVLNFVHPDFRQPEIVRATEDQDQMNPRPALESKYLNLDGGVRDVETVSVPIKYGNQNAWMVTFRDITERKQAQEQVQRSLREKEALLQEIYHRTKNNMQVVSSIINIRSRDITDPISNQMFKEIRDRIAAMSLAHDRLYEAQDLSAIDFKPYLEHLSAHLSLSYASISQRAPIRVSAENVIISIDQAVPLGLVINEILTNAYKYAFPGDRTGEVQLELTRGAAGELLITITDDGIGLPLDAFNDSLSTIIITGLVTEQLGGTVEYDGGNGTRFIIRIPENEIIRRI